MPVWAIYQRSKETEDYSKTDILERAFAIIILSHVFVFCAKALHNKKPNEVGLVDESNPEAGFASCCARHRRRGSGYT